jgi:excisionase family DNA binding protein
VDQATRELLTIEEACARMKVSRRTIYNWLAAGKLQHRRTVSGKIRIYADSLWAPEPPAPAE